MIKEIIKQLKDMDTKSLWFLYELIRSELKIRDCSIISMDDDVL